MMSVIAKLSQADFQLIADSIPHIVWVASSDGSTEYFNRRGTEYTGLPADANYGWDWLSLIHPDDAERARVTWEQSFETGVPEDTEYRIRRFDGEFRWFSVKGVPIRDRDGNVVKWIGTCTDVEAEKHVQNELHEAERLNAETISLLDTLQSTAPIGFGFVDRDFRFVRVNQRLAAMNGTPVEAHIGRCVSEVVPELWPQIEPVYRQVLDTGWSLDIEMSGTTAAEPSRERHWLTSFYPVAVDDGILGIGIVVVDITERKESEQAQEELTRAAVAAIAATVEARDPYTAGHERRVGEISAAIARELGMGEHEIEGIQLAAFIHDIGKISIPAEILARPGALRPAEFELIKGHPKAGYDIIAGITFPWPVATMILQHHERFDGSGYPDGLSGEDLLIGARIIAVADVVEAMASHRPYRAAKGLESALIEIERGRGTQFDPAVVDTCLRLFRQGRLSVDLASH